MIPDAFDVSKRLLIPFIVWFNDFSFMCVFMTLLQAAEQSLLRGMVMSGLFFPENYGQ